VADLAGVIEAMTQRGSSITGADMLAVFEDFSVILVQLLLDGVRVVTPFGEYGLTVKGNFEHATDKFNVRRHQIEVIVKPGKRLARDFKHKTRTRREVAPLPYPTPQHYTNLADPGATNILTPGRIARVTGHGLKFDPTDSRQGLFLIPLKKDSPSEQAGPALRVSEVVRNKGRELLFVVLPELLPGPYRLEVRAVFGQSHLRQDQLRQTLTILPA
jgi:hypothetical protein